MHDAGDGPGAAGRGAGLTLAVVDAESMLEVAQFAAGLAVVAQGRSAGFDGFGQHLADDRHKAGAAFGRQLARKLLGRDAGAEQDLADIDIAKAGDEVLIQQRRFDRRAAAFSAAVR